jgi:PAS domain S-box
LCVVTRTGERRIWEYHNTLRTEGVASPIVRGMARDVTERKRAEAALRNSEQRYRLLFEKNVAGVAIASMNGEVLDCNDSWARMLGYDTAEDTRAADGRILFQCRGTISAAGNIEAGRSFFQSRDPAPPERGDAGLGVI